MSAAIADPAGLWQRLIQWLGLAAGTPSATDANASQPACEADRKSVHDVTLEQLGIAHWTCHTLF